MTAVRIDLALDCGDAQLLSAFWKSALGYTVPQRGTYVRDRSEDERQGAQ
ncbi:VOC family protein [Streptomyces sp. CB00072]|nr:VOC family protein [Streptomyces sp. CB00072]